MSAENTKTETPIVESTTITNTNDQVATESATNAPPTDATTSETHAPETTTDAPGETTTTTNDDTKTDDNKKGETSKPNPTPSRSGTKRLSLFLSKAKKSFVPEKDEKKPTSPVSPASAAETKALPEDPKLPIAEGETAQQEETPAAAEETTASEPKANEPVASTSDDKQEKRKSKFLNGLFKKVATPTKEEKEKEIKTDDQPTEGEPTPKEEEVPATTATEEAAAATEETPAETSAPAVPPKDTPAAVPTKNKEITNVVDQLKRHSFVNKWFGKNKTNTTTKDDEPTTTTSDTAPVIPQPVTTEPITTEDTAPAPADEPATSDAAPAVEEPVTTNDITNASKEQEEHVTEPPKEETAAKSNQEKPARSGSPLGRRLTQILRGFPKKDKKEKKEKVSAAVEEGQSKTDDAAPETPAKDDAKPVTEDEQQEPKPESPAAVATPTVQATA